jgi:hypothetical protein
MSKGTFENGHLVQVLYVLIPTLINLGLGLLRAKINIAFKSLSGIINAKDTGRILHQNVAGEEVATDREIGE